MNVIGGLIIAGIVALLAFDAWIKRRRLLRLPEISSEAFLETYAATVGASSPECDILTVRGQIAKELGLPIAKLSPVQSFIELRDRYCPVISGHIALDDLLEDLWALRRRANLAIPQKGPSTIGEYINLTLQNPR